jgi:hypothetical protein
MPFCRALFALLLCTSFSIGAELRLLSGKSITGDLVKIDAGEVVIKTKDGEVKTPTAQVLELDLAPAAASKGNYSDVELTDGTLLHCSAVAYKPKQVELTLLGGQKVTLPLDAVTYVLNDAQDEKNRKDWKNRFLTEARNSDVVAVKAQNSVSRLKGTFGDVEPEGKKIAFQLNSQGNPVPLVLEKVHGLLFLRQAPASPLPVCKVYDTQGNMLMVSSWTQSDAGFTLNTPSGGKFDFAKTVVTRFDFSKGRLTFLSSLEPSNVAETSTEDRVEHFRRDRNLDDGKIRLRVADEKAPGGYVPVTFDRGLSIHATSEIEYDLAGDYNEFKATVGVDDSVGGSDGFTLVKIEGDGRELYATKVSRKDLAKPMSCNIKNVKRLKIIVTSDDLLDLGKHVSLADARVSK